MVGCRALRGDSVGINKSFVLLVVRLGIVSIRGFHVICNSEMISQFEKKL